MAFAKVSVESFKIDDFLQDFIFRYFYNMANPNLNSDASKQSAGEKEFENNIRPSEIADFAGQPVGAAVHPDVCGQPVCHGADQPRGGADCGGRCAGAAAV